MAAFADDPLMAGFIDRGRAERLMRAAGIDALVIVQPENFAYATGAAPGVAAFWRRAGAAIALVPAAQTDKAAAVVADLHAESFRAASDIADIRAHTIWVETTDISRALPSNRPVAELIAEADAKRKSGFDRPATFDPRASFGLLRELLAERGLANARLGVEFDFLPVNDHALVRSVLPEAELVDSSALIARLRMVKSPREAALLRAGCEISEVGMHTVTGGLRAGQSRAELAEIWHAAVRVEAKRRGVAMANAWEYISVGPDPWSGGGAVEPGAVIKIDVGCVLTGYSSDSGRTFVFGRASDHARAIHAGLHDAFRAGLAEFRPGNTLGAVHRAARQAMRARGFATYSRGHFGHGIGSSVWSEEWPYTGADSGVVLEPGMVMAFETPYYVKGVGGFIIEDQVLVTANGAETMNSLPHELREIG
jgi:Xaa-Pro aminopeptidase